MYKYETHLHTYPVSRCARASVRETLEFYKEQDYDGVFITNHFLDGNVNVSPDLPYKERLDFFFSDYDEGCRIGAEIGLKVFLGVELAHGGTDFLIYGLDREWYYENPQIMDMEKSEELPFMMEAGALVIQAHPYREADYIDHIRLYPRCVHGVEVQNACRKDGENKMAEIYAKHYNLLRFAGTDNHVAGEKRELAGMCSERPITDERDFVNAIKNGELHIFYDRI